MANRLPLPGTKFRADEPTATATSAPAAVCNRIGCGKPTWNGLPNQYCGVPCKQQDEASLPPAGLPAGPNMCKAGCGEPTWDGQPDGFCSSACKQSVQTPVASSGPRYPNCSVCQRPNGNPQQAFCSLICKEKSGGGGPRCLKCGRLPAEGFDTCCQSCVASNGAQHGPQCNAKNSQAGPQCQQFHLCGRPASAGFPTCCRTCLVSGGRQHGPQCEQQFQAFQAARGGGFAYCPPAR